MMRHPMRHFASQINKQNGAGDLIPKAISFSGEMFSL